VSSATPTSLFELDGDRYVATAMSRGPWDPRHCHGGPVSALLARAVEQVDDAGSVSSGDWQIARLTVELTRPVPVGAPLDLAVDVERPGRKVSLVSAVLRDGGTEVARVRALRIRCAAVALPTDANLAIDVPLAPPESAPRVRATWAVGDEPTFHADACEHRFVGGSWDAPGPVEVWIRLEVAVIDDEVPSGVQRVAAAADFGNGISHSLPYEEFVFINPELTVHLLRPPAGEWVGMRTASRYGPTGSGLAESELFDRSGRVGRSCQSLFVSGR
jgi:hypothetical protein